VDTVGRFADLRGITFPLLADEGGAAIGELGLIDPNMKRHHARYATRPLSQYSGTALPGVFVIDEDGTVVEKRFHENRMERDAPATILEEALQIAVPPVLAPVTTTDSVVTGTIYLDSPAYSRWQRHLLTVQLSIEDGWHVYSRDTAPPYHPLSVEISASPDVIVGTPSFPDPEQVLLEELDETAMVHTGNVRMTLPVTAGVKRGTGPIEVGVTVRYQACSSSDCLLPSTLTLDLTVPEAERVS
jgi:hypothetical protein